MCKYFSAFSKFLLYTVNILTFLIGVAIVTVGSLIINEVYMQQGNAVMSRKLEYSPYLLIAASYFNTLKEYNKKRTYLYGEIK